MSAIDGLLCQCTLRFFLIWYTIYHSAENTCDSIVSNKNICYGIRWKSTVNETNIDNRTFGITMLSCTCLTWKLLHTRMCIRKQRSLYKINNNVRNMSVSISSIFQLNKNKTAAAIAIWPVGNAVALRARWNSHLGKQMNVNVPNDRTHSGQMNGDCLGRKLSRKQIEIWDKNTYIEMRSRFEQYPLAW